MVAAPFRATHAARARRARPCPGEGQVEHVVQRVLAPRVAWSIGCWTTRHRCRRHAAAARRAVGSVVRRARASQGDTLHTCRRLLGQPLGGRHGSQPRARRAAPGTVGRCRFSRKASASGQRFERLLATESDEKRNSTTRLLRMRAHALWVCMEAAAKRAQQLVALVASPAAALPWALAKGWAPDCR
jgi:hypothetical protein